MGQWAEMNGDLNRIGEALSFVDPFDRNTWVRVGMAIMSAVGEAGFELWDGWSQGADSYTPTAARNVWKSVKGNGKVTIGTLFQLAKAGGWKDNGPRTPPTPEEQAERLRASQERAAREEVEFFRCVERGRAAKPRPIKRRTPTRNLVAVLDAARME
jgi:putative DNA primase/helicase